MLKVNLTEELDSQRKKTISEDTIVNETQKLLDSNYTKERDILVKIGLGAHIQKVETQVGINLERARLEKNYEGKFFTEGEIKALAMDYNLRLLPTREYKGEVDLQLGYKMKAFAEKFATDNFTKDDFYILAPEKMFNLQNRPKPVPVFDGDPILFYRPNRSDKYMLVHKWGNDFTVFRLLSGFINRTVANFFLSFFVIGFLLSNIVFALFGNYSLLMHGGFSLLIGMFFALIAFAIKMGDTDWENADRKFSIGKWNTIFRD